ncbi:MAG TPA: VanW family protein [Microthrixaceae bacterium]|nr:VanW family protein [Microthrixaceae bacterium]
MSRWKVVLILCLAAPLVAFGLLVALWAALGPDEQPVTVASNVTLAGNDVGGESGDRLDASLRELDESFATTPVRIVTPDFAIDTTAGDLGLAVDVGATKEAALEVGRNDPGPLAPLRWAKSFVSERVAPVTLRVDRQTASAAIVAAEGDRRTKPVEPTMDVSPEKIDMTPGKPGKALDVDDILAQAPNGITEVGGTITIETTQQETRPKVSDGEVLAVIARANNVTSHPLTLKYGETTSEIKGDDLRAGFRLDTSGSTAKLGLDDDYVATLLAERLKVPANPTGVRFDIVNGVPTPVPGTDAVVCCDAGAPATIVAALLDGKSEVTLGTRTVTAAEGVQWANTLGVKEVVGEFTTQHPCCAPRVTNIHKMSDLTKGIIIAPGETFSANDTVGRRTKEKGFVSAPVIEQGKFEEDFGGGVSQWATTTFNAAFFAGLDIPEHKAHSIYISRYPFGREATLAYPSVDLKIKNNTPYGVVIYPTYTNTSITVQLWSTRFAAGAQTAISKSSGCGDVTLTRTRVFVDGHTDTDKFKANYNCNPPEH